MRVLRLAYGLGRRDYARLALRQVVEGIVLPIDRQVDITSAYRGQVLRKQGQALREKREGKVELL